MRTRRSIHKLIGARIRTLRRSQKPSQEEVAGDADLAVSFFAATERGTGNPSLDSLVKIASALDVPLSEVVAGDELERFRDLDRLLKGVPAGLRVLTLKLFADVVSLVKETERAVKARYDR